MLSYELYVGSEGEGWIAIVRDSGMIIESYQGIGDYPLSKQEQVLLPYEPGLPLWAYPLLSDMTLQRVFQEGEL